jgi:hypothetical protein
MGPVPLPRRPLQVHHPPPPQLTAVTALRFSTPSRCGSSHFGHDFEHSGYSGCTPSLR